MSREIRIWRFVRVDGEILLLRDGPERRARRAVAAGRDSKTGDFEDANFVS